MLVFPDVTINDLLSSRVLEITVWSQDGLTSKSLLGMALLGSSREGEKLSQLGRLESHNDVMLHDPRKYVI